MKRVFSTSYEVASLWANQHQDEARCRNSSFSGSKYYSYSTEIARLCTNALGNKLILMCDYYYSHTTNKHKNEVRRVAHYHTDLISVNNVSGDHEYNYITFLESQKTLLDLASRARQRKSEYLRRVESIIQDMKRYATFFSLSWAVPFSELGITATAILKARKVQQEMTKTPRHAEVFLSQSYI